jgi:hypothetical protein
MLSWLAHLLCAGRKIGPVYRGSSAFRCVLNPDPCILKSMSLFSRNRDDRRRRVLAEAGDLAPVTATKDDLGSQVSSRTENAPRYSAGGRRENHLRATDFLPRSITAIMLWFSLALVAVAGLLAGFVSYAQANASDSLGVAPLFEQGGALASWFSSFVFILAAIGSVLIYTVRRHKLDDYRGSYRLWLWCAAAWLVMSIDATANLHAPFSRALAHITGWSMLVDGALWWIAVWGAILAVLSLRLVLELAECRPAQVAIVGTNLLWAAALAIDYGWFPAIPSQHAATAAIGCRLFAEITLLFGIGIYARHMLLDADGLLTHRPPKPRREKPAKKPKAEKQSATQSASAVDAVKKANRVDPPHKPAAPVSQQSSSTWSANRGAANRSASSDDDDEADNRYDNRRGNYASYGDDEDDDSYSDNRKLSKAERKRLRKQARRQQRDDERM